MGVVGTVVAVEVGTGVVVVAVVVVAPSVVAVAAPPSVGPNMEGRRGWLMPASWGEQHDMSLLVITCRGRLGRGGAGRGEEVRDGAGQGRQKGPPGQ